MIARAVLGFEIRISIFLIILLGLFMGTVHTEKVCQGTNNGISVTDNAWFPRRYNHSCTKIDGNLEINEVGLKLDGDLSYLSSIEEITGYLLVVGNQFDVLPLPNLKIIRGETTFDLLGPKMSFLIANNKIKEIQLSSLTEIQTGGVSITNNPKLCHMDTVSWEDIVKGDVNITLNENGQNCDGCHPECPLFKDRRYCWGPGVDQCQNLTRIACHESCADRCFGPDRGQCCSKSCAAGCFGNGEDQCHFCSLFENDEKCQDSCPPVEKYNPITFQYEPDLNGKFSFGHKCVTECPDHMYENRGACVKACEPGSTAKLVDGRNKCVPCDGVCPKVCQASDVLTNETVSQLKDCTIVQGSLKLNMNLVKGDKWYAPLTDEQWRLFETITTVEDYLYIDFQGEGKRDLKFLKNLRQINGKSLKGTCALYIYKTNLTTIDLPNLKSIANGDLCIIGNEDLCFMASDQSQWKHIEQRNNMSFRLAGNKNPAECEKDGLVCSFKCLNNNACFGSSDEDCVECKDFKEGTKCLQQCSPGWYYPEPNGTDGTDGGGDVMKKVAGKECLKCHQECKGTCRGPGADQCLQCLNYKDGPYCVERCPLSKYPNSKNNCQPCHSDCKEGCTGNSTSWGPGGCNECFLYLMDDSGSKKQRCLQKGLSCPDSYYTFKEVECHKCHSECTECFGHGASGCNLATCKNVILDNRCANKCPSDFYVDSEKTCRPCYEECSRCSGPTYLDCTTCRGYKVYHDYENRQKNPKFNCTSDCPEHLPNQIQETVNNLKYSICVSDKDASEQSLNPRRSNAGLIIGIVFGCLVLLGLITALIFFLKRQTAQKDLAKKRLEAKIGGFEEMEPLVVTGAAPDTAALRIIKESELRKDEEIGSGAFGTVYKGVWVPANENIRMPVAIKVLKEGTTSMQNKEFLDEARIMASVNHPNCVRLAAICMTNPVQLITPLMPFGSLLDYLRKNKACIGSKVLLNWATQIAKGMKYLEDRGIVHRDLAARNVLVKNANNVKITDFGLSKLLDVDQESVKAVDEKLPIKWMAVESIRHRIFTHKSDVWSYGVTIWELFTYGQRPYEYLSATDVLEALEKGERLTQPEICTIDIYMIMIKCWMVDAESRPNFQELVEEFSKMSRDPGRYLVIQGDQFMKLPVKNPDAKDLISDCGPEKLMLADDYYQTKQEEEEDDNYLKPKKDLSDFPKKSKGNKYVDQHANKYTSDPTEIQEDSQLDIPIDSDYGPTAPIVSGEGEKKQPFFKGSQSSLSNLARMAMDGISRSSEYLKMNTKPPKEERKAILAEFEDDTIDDDDDDYLKNIKSVKNKSHNNNNKNNNDQGYYNTRDPMV